MSEKAKPRRWLRFSLRTFFLLVTVLCVSLGLYMKQKRDQQFAVKTILDWNGKVRFDYEPSDRERAERALQAVHAANLGSPPPVFVDRPPPGPVWLRRLLGDHFFADVVVVELPYLKEKSVDLEILSNLTNVKRLRIGAIKDIDDQLKHLERLQNLEVLGLGFSNVTDRGLQHVARLRNLKTLSLCYTQVTDTGLLHLSSLRELEHLEIQHTNVTDAGVERLRKQLPNFEIVP